MTQPNDIVEAYCQAGQSHLFKYWNEANAAEKSTLLKQLNKIPDPRPYLNDVKDAIEYSSQASVSRNVNPLPSCSYSSTLEAESNHIMDKWLDTGLDLLKKNQVGVLLMAGGQGTRLGSDDPKGCYNVGLPSGKSLFQLQCERILRLQNLVNEKFKIASCIIPLYIMTSGPTRSSTELFFIENNYFGLRAENVVFFNQGVLPAVDLTGEHLLLQDKYSLVESPDGNGGLYKAIYDNNLLQDFSKRNILHLHMYCVDNVLVKVADPVFLGYSFTNGYDIATKVVRKRDVSEKVGLIVLDEDTNAPCVIEYSEVSKELSEEKDETGKLRLRAGNIVNHYYNVDFLTKMVPKWISSRKHLPYHVAKKAIKSLDLSTGEISKPQEPNGLKMEQFIFDVFPSVKLSKFGCLEVERTDEFSPLKNAPGSANDSPETARLSCLERSTKWVVENGGIIDDVDGLVEVSPLTSYSGEGLEFVKGKHFKSGDII